MIPQLFTIGYEGCTQSEVITTLKKADIKLLLDIRAVPLSRKKGFSKNGLKDALEAANINYVHLKELGTPKLGREAARKGQHQVMHNIFTSHMQRPEAQEALQTAVKLATRSPACLLCFEHNHAFCHRNIVAALMQEQHSFTLHHLHPQPELK